MDGTSKWETAGTILWQEQEGRRDSRNSGPLLSLHGGCVSIIFLEKSRFWRCILVGSEGRWWRFDRVFHRRKSGTHDNQSSKNIIRVKKTICWCLTCMGKPMKLSEFKYFGDLTTRIWDQFFRKMQHKSQDLGFEDPDPGSESLTAATPEIYVSPRKRVAP